MNVMNLVDYQETAIEAAQQAARIQMFHLGGDLEIDTKSTDCYFEGGCFE